MHVLKAHMKQHKENESEREPVVCDICKKAFTSKLYLKKHLQWHSEGNKSDDEQFRRFMADNFDMNCDRCDVVFTTFHDARRHYKDLHNEKKGYIKCCETKLNEFWLVIDHIQSHLNPKIFKLVGSFQCRSFFFFIQTKSRFSVSDVKCAIKIMRIEKSSTYTRDGTNRPFQNRSSVIIAINLFETKRQ